MQIYSKHLILSCLLLFLCFPLAGFGQTNTKEVKKRDTSFTESHGKFYNITTFIPVSFTGQILCGLQTICGYRINDHFSVGAGIGYEKFNSLTTYENFKADLSQLPIFADIRYTFLKGRFLPEIAINGGYKFLLNRPSTQIRIDTVYGNVLGVESRNDYSDYNIFKQGGFFITGEAGVKAKVYKRVAILLALDYSLWTVSGDYHLRNELDLLGGDNIWRMSGKPVNTTDKSLAYVYVFLIRLGVAF